MKRYLHGDTAEKQWTNFYIDQTVARDNSECLSIVYKYCNDLSHTVINYLVFLILTRYMFARHKIIQTRLAVFKSYQLSLDFSPSVGMFL